MVSKQKEFNKEYFKEIKEIEIEYEDFEGQLVIEDYPNLEKLYLQNIDKIGKVTLKNLTQLQECTIWDCGTEELIIENCLRIKKLNVENNSLGSLEFLKDLGNLEELKLTGNTKLSEILEPYYNKSGLD